MTGNSRFRLPRFRLPRSWGLGGLLLLAAPASAQLPNAGDTGPRSALPPVAAPAPAEAIPAPAPAGLSRPKVDVRWLALSGPTDRPHLVAPRVTYGGELTLDSDTADLAAGRYDLRGHVRAHEADTTVRAGEITLSGQNAEATDALLTRGVFSIRAPRIAGTPTLITAYDGRFTTVPGGGPADYFLQARTITLDSIKRRGTLRHVTLSLFGARLLTIPRLTFGLGGAGGAGHHPLMIPTLGVSSRYGTYVAFGGTRYAGPTPFQYRLLLPTRQSVQAELTSRQTLYAPRQRPPAPPPYAGPETLLDRIRAAATLPVGVLPEGDPLRFEDFLPEPNPISLFDAPSHGGLSLGEDLSVHVAASGRRRNDLYVSRLPEFTLSGDLPLTPVPAAPRFGDPQSFRAALRHVVLYLQAQSIVGDYREQLTAAPYSIRARRTRSQIGLSARPLLIAPDTVLLPSVSVSTSSYSGGKSAYRYDQLSVAVNHYFSDLTAVGVQLLVSSTSGDSPFNFDVLDTSRELDVRFQTGNSRLIAAGRVRYDLSRGDVIDYQAALGPALRGFIPIFSYNFRTRSLGLGVEVKGLTF